LVHTEPDEQIEILERIKGRIEWVGVDGDRGDRGSLVQQRHDRGTIKRTESVHRKRLIAWHPRGEDLATIRCEVITGAGGTERGGLRLG